MNDSTPSFELPQIPAKSGGVYCIHNAINGKRYIGSSQDLAKRLAWHVGLLDRGVHPNRHLQAAWCKYGKDSFRCDVLEITDLDSQYAREQHYIDTVQPEYNLTALATGGPGVVGESTRKKHSVNSRKRWADPEYKGRLSVKFAEVNALPGVKRKRSEAGKERWSSTEARAAAAERSKQQWTDPKYRERISEANKGRPPAKATREAVAEANRKRVWTEESRRKMSEASKYRWASRRSP